MIKFSSSIFISIEVLAILGFFPFMGGKVIEERIFIFLACTISSSYNKHSLK